MSIGDRYLYRGGKKVKVDEKTALQTRQQAAVQALEKAIMEWDFSGLNEVQRLTYLKSVCKECGLNIKLKPFTYIRFQGKVIPYIGAEGTAQLRSINKISSQVIEQRVDKDTNILTTRVKLTSKDGRSDEAVGAISIAGLKALDLANAYMKCETKAKRRATLSLTGMLQFDTPTGEEEPIRQSDIEQRVEKVVAKTETIERPAFESILSEAETDELQLPLVTQGEGENRPPVPPSDQGYVMKSGRNRGKFLKDMSKAKLTKWMSWYHEVSAAGTPLHQDVQDDAFHVKAQLEGPQDV